MKISSSSVRCFSSSFPSQSRDPTCVAVPAIFFVCAQPNKIKAVKKNIWSEKKKWIEVIFVESTPNARVCAKVLFELILHELETQREQKLVAKTACHQQQRLQDRKIWANLIFFHMSSMNIWSREFQVSVIIIYSTSWHSLSKCWKDDGNFPFLQ